MASGSYRRSGDHTWRSGQSNPLRPTPARVRNLTAIILPWLELFLGIFLVLGVCLPGAALLCNLLLVAFFVALVFNLARGLDIHCGCFTTSQEATLNLCMCLYMIRDEIFLLLELYLFSHIFFKEWQVVDESHHQ